MTDALDKLIEAVEAGADVRATMVADAFPERELYFIARHACLCGSLDAAKALHEALLPGWAAILDIDSAKVDMHSKYDDGERNPSDEWEWMFDVQGIEPARAWLLAILKAYRSVRND